MNNGLGPHDGCEYSSDFICLLLMNICLQPTRWAGMHIGPLGRPSSLTYQRNLLGQLNYMHGSMPVD